MKNSLKTRKLKISKLFHWFTKTRRRKILSSILSVLFVLISARFVFFTGGAEAAWWPGDGTGSWTKRKQLTITNNSGDNLASGTTVAVTIDAKGLASSGKLQDDCDDLRVIYDTGSTQTEVIRYISVAGGVTCGASGASKVHFPLQFALNDTNSDTDYYIYYGNPSATAPSNPDNAFDIGSKDALLVCPFDGTTTCAAGEPPSTESGAIRYGGSKSALEFDGVNDHVTASPSNSTNNLALSSDYTAEAWIKVTRDYCQGSERNAPIIDKRGGGANGWFMMLRWDGSSNCFIWLYQENTTTDSDYRGTVSLSTGQWYHVAAVYDSSNKTAKTFLNGTETSYWQQTPGSGTPLDDSAGGVDVGNDLSSYTFLTIDEVRLSNVARYSSDFTTSTSPFVRDEYTALLYHFDENGDDPRNSGKAIDDSGNGNHGTITGAKYVAGLVGVDASTSDTGKADGGNTYAGHEGIFVEEGTTNKITNPSFEHSTYDTNWTLSGGAGSKNTTAPYYKYGSSSYKIVLSGTTNRNLYTSINAGNTGTHTLSAYVYDGTSGNIGGIVENTVAQLYWQGSAQSTTIYTDMGGGWWRLTYSAAGTASAQDYGVTVVEDSGTLYVDGVQLEYTDYTGGNDNYATSYTDGSLGSNYSWSGTENNSTSIRTEADLRYADTSNISYSAGSASFWLKPTNKAYSCKTDAWSRFFVVGETGAGGYLSFSINCNTIQIVIDGNTEIDIAESNLTSNRWHHVMITWDGTNVYLYIDGSSKGNDTYTGFTGGDIKIGGSDDQSADSTISDLRIFDDDLTSIEIIDLYNSGLVGHSEGIEVDAFSDDKGQNPVAIWHFDEGSGATAYDSSQNANHLTLDGLTGWRANPSRSSLSRHLSFDGYSASASRSGELREFNFGTGSFSVGGWFRHSSSISGTDTILSRYGSTGYKVYMNSSGYICVGVDDDTTWGPDDEVCSTTTHGSLADSRWHHFEAVVDRDSSPTVARIYIDGIEANYKETLTATATLSSSSTLVVGADASDGTPDYWDGDIDELIVYPYARTTDQVKTDVLGGSRSTTLGVHTKDWLTEGLVGYWKMDETSGHSYDSNEIARIGYDVNSTTYNVGKYGNAADFESTSSQYQYSVYALATQPDENSSKDTYLRSAAVDNTHGTSTYISQDLDNRTTLIEFDVSSIPASATCVGATLSLWSIGSQAGVSYDIYSLHSNVSDWTEGTGNGVAGDASWNEYKSGSSWPGSVGGRTSGTDYEADISPPTITNPTSADTEAQADLTTGNNLNCSRIEGWFGGSNTNYGLIIGATGSTLLRNWHSSSTSTASYWPRLHVIYSKSSNEMDYTGDVVVSAWINPESDTASTQYDIAGKWDGADENYLLAQYGDEIRFYINSASNYEETTAASLETGAWYHVVGVYDSGSQEVNIYIDGELESSSTSGTIPSSITSSSARFHIGAEDSTTSATNFYDGKIDELRVYNRTLSPFEVQDLYNWAPGPVGYWKMDEASWTNDCSTGTVLDSSGNGNNGKSCPSSTGPTTTTNGIYGKAGYFDGSDDYVDLGFGRDYSNLNSLTFSFWVKIDSLSNSNRFIRSISSKRTIRINSSGAITGLVNTSGTNGECQTGVGTLATDTWYNIAMTYDDGGDRYVRIYVNGVLANCSDKNNPATGTISAIGGETIMLSSATGNNLFGLMDEARIYNYARSQGQVIEDMNAGHPAPGSPVGSSILHWKFDEGYGDTANDSSSQNDDGDLFGSCPGAATCPSWTNNGKFGKALDFDGGDYVLGSELNFSSGPFSISLWFNTSVTASQYIVSKVAGFADSINYYINMNSSGYIIAAVRESGTTQVASNDVQDYGDSNWHNVVMVVTETELFVYVDGIIGNTTDTHSNVFTTNATNFQVGAATAFSSYFTGQIDEVKVYRLALTADQIKTEYNQGSAAVWGATSTDSSDNASWSTINEYCPPGQGTSCTAPVLEWLFDENTGTYTANDTSDNANSGTMFNFSENDWVPGKNGSALRFDGSSTYIEDSSKPITAYPFTISAWAKTEASGSTYTIAGLFDDVDTDRYQVIWISGNVASATSRQNGDGGRTASGTTIINDGVWYHIVGVFTSSTDRRIYVDGVEEGSNTTSAIFEANIDNATVGVRNTPSHNFHFDGDIDQVRFYNYARSQAQIAWEYNRGAPIAWWKFDECSGTQAFDSSGNGNTGTITPGTGTPPENTATGTCSSGNNYEMWNDGTNGKRNASLGFDGNDDFVDTVDISFSTGGFAFSGWFKSSGTSFQPVIRKRPAGGATGDVYIQLEDDSMEGAVNDGSWQGCQDYSRDWSDGAWHHATVTVDSSTVKLYGDGALLCSDTHDNTLTTNTDNWLIGGVNRDSNYLDGLIDDVKIFNYPLTDEQVRNDYNSGVLFFGPATGSP